MKILLLLALFSIANGQILKDLEDFIDSPIDNVDDLLQKTLDSSWHAFKDMFGKSYNEEEEPARTINFENNLKKAAKHNAMPSNYTLGVNKYSDLSPQEVRSYLMGFRGRNNYTSTSSPYSKGLKASSPSTTVDWRTKGYVTPVKDQGSCGSCYSFSATGALEGQVKKKTGKLVSLSEQNIIDCSMSEGNGGCDGGWMNQAFKWIQKNKGISTEAGYPYIEDVNPVCAYNKATKGATVTGYVNIPEGDEQALKKTVANVGPVSVAVNADGDFGSYKSGIYDPDSCPNTIDDLSHAVLLVGYGTENGEDYWLVKNSWGTTWGLDGYIKMARNKNNLCGIATKASYPLV